eukprot:SAG11_NODE_1944_length_4019_cov_2.495792_2_plen_164_part_00
MHAFTGRAGVYPRPADHLIHDAHELGLPAAAVTLLSDSATHMTDMVAPKLSMLLLSLRGLGAACACSHDGDCSYNGVCDKAARSCACDPQWEGAHCARLRLLPASKRAGFRSPHVAGPEVNVSSWGGSILFDEATSTWHMFSAEMINDCAALQSRSMEALQIL